MKLRFVLPFLFLGITAAAGKRVGPAGPIANAGPDQTIYLSQTSTVTLNGSASSGDSYQWTDVSTDYKSSAKISSPNAATTTVTGLQQGTWYYQLSVSSGGMTSTDLVVIRVDYDLPPSNGVLLRDLPLAEIYDVVNDRRDTTRYIETGKAVAGGDIIFDRSRLNGEFIDAPKAKFYSIVEDGYGWGGSNYARSEVSFGSGYGLKNKTTYCFEWKGYYPQDFSYLAPNSNVTSIMQIHGNSDFGNDGDSPPFQFVINNGDLRFIEYNGGGNGANTNVKIGNLSDYLKQTHTIRLTVREGYAGENGFVKIEVDGVQKYYRNSGQVGATIGHDYIKFATVYDWGKFLVDPSKLSRGRKFALVTESFKVYQLTDNQTPTASAGSDQEITLPDNSASLSGKGKDPDGSIQSYSWKQLSGPSSGKITSSENASTTVTGLVKGTYQFQLTVTDNNGATGSSTVQVIVNPEATVPPVAKAGPNQNIQLPVNSVKLTGSGTTETGTITGYSWKKKRGPSGGTITNPSSAVTNVTDLEAGEYTFEFTVTNSQNITASDTLHVTVISSPNISPSALAGSDKEISLPVDEVSLSGKGKDQDGTVDHFQWIKISGPSAENIHNPGASTTVISGLKEGIYQFEFSVTDNDGAVGKDTVLVTVHAAANTTPIANAGAGRSITLPVNFTSLSGSGSDADGNIQSYLWVKISGPETYKIATPDAAETEITQLVQGDYQFELTVTDNKGGIAKDTVAVKVNPVINLLPVADAGTDKKVILPANSLTLSGSGKDEDGTVKDFKWTQLSGPSTSAIMSPGEAVTKISELEPGIYLFELTVTDDKGGKDTDTVRVRVEEDSNDPPIANAGTDKTISLPVNSVALSGSSNVEGVTFLWTKISGPSFDSISDATTAFPKVTGLIEGQYQFELLLTDGKGNTGKDTVQVTVLTKSNIQPVADAGADKMIQLPSNTVSIEGSANDADGSIRTYHWKKIAGPPVFTIVSPDAAVTDISDMVEGEYEFELTVTDDGGGVGKDSVRVKVTAAENKIPKADAGPDKSITLPTDSVLLSGSGEDSDGTIKGYQWSLISGPASGKFANSHAASTLVSGLKQGVYEFELALLDNKGAIGKDTMFVKVNALSNKVPVASAGSDKTITLPKDSVSLAGSGSDVDGNIKEYRWKKIAGPTSFTIENAGRESTMVSSLVAGLYQFEFSVTDDKGDTGKDTVSITVKAKPNEAPVASAGQDQAITLPETTVTLSGKGTDPDGTVTHYLWTKVSGPLSGKIADSRKPTTDIADLTAGIYQYVLTVTDNGGLKATDTVQVRVNAKPNAKPTAIAGPDQTVTLPVNTVTLSGSGNDEDGTIERYQWKMISGPATCNFTDSTNDVTEVISLVQGLYQFELTVTDNKGGTGKDTLRIKVNEPSNRAPAASAGANKTIHLPSSSVTLSGTGVDADGEISRYSWKKIAGPIAFTITNPDAATTLVSGLVQGVYEFELTVTDDKGSYGMDTVQVKVNAASNKAPSAEAGAGKTITLPVSSVTLSGSGSDADGTILKFSWRKIAGPLGFTIVSPDSATTVISGLEQGIYRFEFKVTDNKGDVGMDTVQVKVNEKPNQAPTADAGANRSITLPASSVTLSGSGNDRDGNISKYNWKKIAGPTDYRIVSPDGDTTLVSGLVKGVYQFELKVTDNKGGVGMDTVQITVKAQPNRPPTVDAGSGVEITLPENTITLSGNGYDPDGNISTYYWVKVGGPSAYLIANPASPATEVSGMSEGVYSFELTVKDSAGLTGKDTVRVRVKAQPNRPPVSNAGQDIVITLPTNKVTLSGSGSDPDGTLPSYQWTKLSGPENYKIVDSSSSITEVLDMVEGIYQFQLTVRDNKGATDQNVMQVTVAPAAVKNIPPTAQAGSDKSITLPVNKIVLSGEAADADGTIRSYQWNKISGPSEYEITAASSLATEVTGLVEGTYTFELVVTDDKGETAKSVVKVTVVKPRNTTVTNSNEVPLAYAGRDTTVVGPVEFITLRGSGSDSDGSIVNYKWNQLSGPSNSSIVSNSSAITTVDNLEAGTYYFELSVSDNRGAVAKDTVEITIALGRYSRVTSDLKVYPNPVHDFVNLEINTGKAHTSLIIIITDMAGKSVYRKELVSSTSLVKERINMSNLIKGVYAISVYFDGMDQKSVKVVRL